MAGAVRQECQALIVQAGERRVALPVDVIAEVFAAVEVTSSGPQANGLTGHVNVRGEVLPAIELRSLLGEPSRPLRLADRMILMDWGIGRALVVVDDAVGLAWVGSDADPAGGGPGGIRPATSRDDGGIVSLVDVAEALGPVIAPTERT